MSPDAYEAAIKPWWSGGGTARRLVDVLDRSQATESEARFVAQRLTAAAERLNVITEPVIENEIEMVRARFSSAPAPHAREFDSRRCVYEDGVVCPECREYEGGSTGKWQRGSYVEVQAPPVIHGHPVDRLVRP